MKNKRFVPEVIHMLCVALLLCLAGTAVPAYSMQTLSSAQPSDIPATPAVVFGCDSSVICPHEDLLYEVSYAGIKLGRIRIRTQATDTIDGETRHHAMAYVDSYEGIPFVDIHVIDSSHMNTAFYSKGFDAFEKSGDYWLKESSRYDLNNHIIIIEKTRHKEPRSPVIGEAAYDTVRNVEDQILDGLSMFFFARGHVRENASMDIPTVVYAKQGTTEFHFGTERKMEEIDALKDKLIRVVGLEGTAHFKGLYGMTGDFRGWFSDDPASIPIKAEIGVFIGNVDIELIWWRRHNWEPPTIPKE
jgi:hypothetical protein